MRLRSNASERRSQAAARSKSGERANGSGALAGGNDPRHSVDALFPAALREQIPDAGLEDEAERVEPACNDGRALAVADVEPPAAPERSRDHRQMRDPVLFTKPAARLEVEQPRRSVGALLQLGGQGGEELQPCRRQLAAESELGCRSDEERLRLGSVEAGQLRPVAAIQAVAACRAPDGDDRDAGLRECLRVALHRSLGHLEPLGELRGGQLPPRLQHEQKGDEPARAHVLEPIP